ncbi:MAG: hypothetical protein WBX25_06630 [Rhodomicrobium sp.]
MLSDYLDAYALKNERDDAVAIIRKCQRILTGNLSRDDGEKELLIGRLLEVLDGPEAAAIIRRNDKFLSHVS